MAANVILTWILTALGLLQEATLIAERPLTSFIWKRDTLSWTVGFLGGIAGMLAGTSAKSGALVGRSDLGDHGPCCRQRSLLGTEVRLSSS